MSLKFHCRNCGWSESAHLFKRADCSPAEEVRRHEQKPRFGYSLMECLGYEAQQPERVAVKQLELAASAQL